MIEEYKTLHTKFAEIASQFPQQEVLQIKKNGKYVTFTNIDILEAAKKIAAKLILAGIGKGDRIALVLENRPEWVIIYFAIMFAGAIAIPIDPQTSEKDLAYYLQDSESKIAFTSTLYVAGFNAISANLNSLQKIVVLDIPNSVGPKIIPYTDLLQPTANVIFPEVAVDELASILYTSGTTGKPKGVMLSHKNFYANYLCEKQIKIITSGNNLLAILPLHHSFPFLATVMLPLFKQCKVTFPPSLKSDELLACMRETGVTIFPGVPQMFYLFAKHIKENIQQQKFYVRWFLGFMLEIFWWIRRITKINLTKKIFKKIHAPFGEKFQFFVSGGAKLNPEVELDLNKLGFTILQGYGLTETAPGVSFNHHNHEKLGSAGKVIPGVEVKIDRPDAKGIGEIVIRGPNVMRGYYKNPEATAEVLKDGWFYSGDLGYLDRKGNLFIVGRKKEIIVLSSGKNISPEEVEAHYAECNFIKELCVLELVDGKEEKLVAVVHPDFDYFRKAGEINIHHSIRWGLESFSKNYPAYKHIMGFVITKDDLPRTRLGKLKRYEIKEKYLPQLQGATLQREVEPPEYSEEEILLVSSDVGKLVSTTIKQELNLNFDPGLNDHLELDLGLDSLRRIELIGILEKNFKISLPTAVVSQIFSIKELIAAITAILQNKDGVQQLAQDAFSWQAVLATPPPKEIVEQIALAPNVIDRLGFDLLCWFIRAVSKIFWRLKINGAANVPPNQNFVFCCNHASFLDGFIFAASVPKWVRQQIFILGHRRFFDSKLMRKLVWFTRVIPVDSAGNLVNAMQASSYVITNKKSILIFPEGERSINGELIGFRKGVGILAKELNIELLPVYIHGSYAAWPRGERFPKFKPVQIYFGKPCAVSILQTKGYALGAKDDYEAIAVGVREEIVKMQGDVIKN